ncbi:MAG: trigger factor [Candidatus Gastranaerophilales bacterium]|nr:trigger factor [Candidatus Gastranaerophilales bacterium]
MSIEIEKLDNNEVKLNIAVDAKTASKEYDKACKKLSERVNIPGFRPGKAPKPVLEKHIGVDAIQREVLENILPNIFAKAIYENKLDIVTEPSVEEFAFADDKALTVVAKLELRPEVNLCDYKGVEIEIEEFKNDDDSLDKELAVLADKYAEFKTVEGRKSNATDIVNIDFDGEVDGEKIKGGAAKGYTLDLGNSTFIPGFAEQLVDKEVGSEFTIDVKFPDNYHDETIKGKDAKFAIKLNEIKEKVAPEINDEFAKKVGNFKNVDELKADIQKYLDNTAKMENDKRISTKLFEKITGDVDVNIQESMIKREARALMGEFQQRVAMQGGNWDEMLEKEGHEKVWEELSTEAKTRIKSSLIIAKIAQEEKIMVEPMDLERKVEEIAKIYQTDKMNIVKELQKNQNLINSLSQQILSQKVTQFLIDNAKVKYNTTDKK